MTWPLQGADLRSAVTRLEARMHALEVEQWRFFDVKNVEF